MPRVRYAHSDGWPKRGSWHWNSKTDWGPGGEGHRKQRWNVWLFFTSIVAVSSTKQWSLNLPFAFKLHMNANHDSAVWGPNIRRGKFQKFVIEARIPGVELKVHYAWPRWIEELDVFYQHRDVIHDKQSGTDTYLASLGCPVKHSFWNFTKTNAQLIPAEPQWVNGQVSVVHPVFGLYCGTCKERHGIWPGPLADLLNSRSIRDQRDDEFNTLKQTQEFTDLLKGTTT